MEFSDPYIQPMSNITTYSPVRDSTSSSSSSSIQPTTGISDAQPSVVDIESRCIESILGTIAKNEGKSSLESNLRSQSSCVYSLTSTQIQDMAKRLRELPRLSIRIQSSLTQQLVIRLCMYYKYCQLIDIKISDLHTLLEYAPWGDLYDVITKYGNLFRIHQLESPQVSYLSGVMLHDVSVEYHQKYHRENFDRLHSLSLDGLIDFCRKIHSNIIYNIIYSSFLDTSLLDEEHIGNTTDTLLVHELRDYYPFDVVYYIDENKKIYGIVRTEFDYIMEKRENPYTRRRIPTQVLVEIQKRNNLCKIFSLGNCQSISDTWERLLNPTAKCEDILPRIEEIGKKNYHLDINSLHNGDPMRNMDRLAEFFSETELSMLHDEDEEDNDVIPQSSNQRYPLPNRIQPTPIVSRHSNTNMTTPVHSPYSNQVHRVDVDEDGNHYYGGVIDINNPFYGVFRSSENS